MMRSALRLAASATSLVVDGAAAPLERFIVDGPLFRRCFPNAADGAAVDMAKWEACGQLLTKDILKRGTGEGLTKSEAIRVYQV